MRKGIKKNQLIFETRDVAQKHKIIKYSPSQDWGCLSDSTATVELR